jgi:hypothetical protein
MGAGRLVDDRLKVHQPSKEREQEQMKGEGRRRSKEEREE